MAALFDPDQWLGSYYELAIELSSSADDARLRAAIAALLTHRCIRGPWCKREDMDGPVFTSDEGLGDLSSSIAYSTIHVPPEEIFGGVIHTVRDEGESSSDWLDLCIPTGMLGRVYEIQYPIVGAANPWRSEVDEVFVTIADRVYAHVPFDLAIVGEECSGYVRASEIDASYLERGHGYLLSPKLFRHIESKRHAKQLPSGLLWIAEA